MELGNVCRLCCRRNPVINVFNEKLDCGDYLRYSILLATGIQIKEDDKITKKVCRPCCETVLKMHKYRNTAVANDRKLKEIIGQNYTTPVTDQVELQKLELEIFPTQENTKSPEPSQQKPPVPSMNCIIRVENPSLTTLHDDKDTFKHTYKFAVHPSVRRALQNNKNLILPKHIFKCDISPIIILDNIEVQKWFALNKFLNTTPSIFNSTMVHDLDSTEPQKDGFIIENKDEEYASTLNLLLTQKVSSLNIIRNVSDLTINNDEYIKGRASFNRKENHVPSNISVDCQTNQSQPERVIENPIMKNSCISKIKLNHRQIRKRKNIEGDSIEIIPRKKKRIYRNKGAIKALNKVDLPHICPMDTEEQKVIFTSSLELQPVNTITIQNNDILTDTTNTAHRFEVTENSPEWIEKVPILKFICPICSKMYYNKRSLMIHKQKHPKCKLCRARIKSKDLLHKHMSEICPIPIIRNQPYIILKKIDSIESIVKKYPGAFKICESERINSDLLSDENDELLNNEFIDYSQLKVVHTTNNYTLSRCNNESNKIKTQTDVVLLISDDECDNFVSKPINYNSMPDKSLHQDKTENADNSHHQDNQHDRGLSILSSMKENEMISNSVKKYFKSGTKTDNISQTFIPSNCNIEPNKHNIKLKCSFTELLTYAVPLWYKQSSELGVTFGNNLTRNVLESPTLVCWDQQHHVTLQAPSNNLTIKTYKSPVVAKKLINNINSTTCTVQGNNVLLQNTVPKTTYTSTSDTTITKCSNASSQLNVMNTQHLKLQPLVSKTYTSTSSSNPKLYIQNSLPTNSINKSHLLAKTSVIVNNKVPRQQQLNYLIPQTVTSPNDVTANLNYFSNPATAKNYIKMINNGNINMPLIPSNTVSLVPFMPASNTQYSVANTSHSTASVTFNPHSPDTCCNENYNVTSPLTINCDSTYIDNQQSNANITVNQIFNYPQNTVAISGINYHKTNSNLSNFQDNNSLNQTNEAVYCRRIRVKTTRELS